MTDPSTLSKRYGIFVSYAHDDEKLDSWVSKLRYKLGEATAIDLKNRDNGNESNLELKFLMDHEFSRVGSISDRIKEQLDQSDILLVVMSPSYLNSDWCKREGEWFTQEQHARQNLRIFIVEKEHTERHQWPCFLKDQGNEPLFSHEFYRRSNTNEYEPREITDEAGDLHPGTRSVFRKLRRDVSETLWSLNQPISGGTQPIQASATAGTAFLALTSDDLKDYERAELETLMAERGIRVLPSFEPTTQDSLEASVREQLKECDLFVQLLSRARASYPVPDPTGGIRFQFDAARANNLPVLQWLSSDVQIERIANPEYRAFLEERKSLASQVGDIPALVQEIERELERIRASPDEIPLTPTRKKRCMGINWDRRDEALAKELRRRIKEACPDGTILPVLPSTEMDWQERKEVYEECDGMILVWGKAGPKWVFRQIHNVFPELWPMETDKAKALADFEKPPAEEKLGFDPKEAQSVEVLDFTDGLDTESLREFCSRL